MTSPSLSLRITLLVQVHVPPENRDPDPDPEPAARSLGEPADILLHTPQVAVLAGVPEAEVARAARRRRMVGGRFTLAQARALLAELRGAQRAEAV